MLSADPILIVNCHDQASVESAEVRTDLATSGLTISGASAPDSLVKYVVMALIAIAEDGHVSSVRGCQVVRASNFKTSGDTFDFKREVHGDQGSTLLAHPQ